MKPEKKWIYLAHKVHLGFSLPWLLNEPFLQEALEGTIRHLLHLIGEIEPLHLHNCVAEIIRENIFGDLWLHTRNQDKKEN